MSERIASDDETEDKTKIRAYLSIYSQLRLKGLQVNRADSLIRPLLSGPDYLSHIEANEKYRHVFLYTVKVAYYEST